MPHKPGHKKKKKTFVSGQVGTGPGSRVELLDRPSAKGKPSFIPKAEAPGQFKKLRGKDFRFPGTIAGAGSLSARELTKIQRAKDEAAGIAPQQETQEATKTKTGVTGFLQKLPGGSTDQEIEAATKKIEDEGVFRAEELPGAIGDALLLGPTGEFAGRAAGLGIKALRGGKAAGQAATEFSKLSKTRQQVVTELLKGSRGTGSVANQATSRELVAPKLAKILSRPGARVTTDGAIRAINSFNKWNKGKVISFLTKKPVKKTLAGAAAVAGADIIWTWYALDNIATGLKFTVPDIAEGVQNGTMSREDAIDAFNETDLAMQSAVTKVNISARINPLLWPAAKNILSGVRISQRAYEIKKANVIADLGL